MANSSSQIAFDTNGTLGRVWLAAHWDKKLTKNNISSHSISESVSIIKSPGNLYSLRISGYLLLGLVKIYSKKSILALEELEQSLQSLSSFTSGSSEVLREIGLTEVPEKLKLIPLKKPEIFNPLLKPVRQVANEKIILQEAPAPTHHVENEYEENDLLGITTSFLDDVEMAEQWLRKDAEEAEVGVPAIRPRERVWQNFIATNLIRDDDEVVLPDPPEVAAVVKREEPRDEELEQAEQVEEVKDFELAECKIERPTEKRKTKQIRKIVKNSHLGLTINTDEWIGLDCTADIIKNTKLFQPLVEILPNDIEQIFYIPVIKDIAPELENFYFSQVKIQRLKNLFREEEDKEPVILSNISAERPENPIEACEPSVQEPVNEIVPEPIPKIEKTEEKGDESWSSRTLKLLKLLKVRLSNQKFLKFEELSKKLDRRVMACGFYEVLQLCLKDFVVMENREENVVLRATDRLLRLSIM